MTTEGEPMIECFDIAGYCRISVDEELDQDKSGCTLDQWPGWRRSNL